ncbi:MULTISPECIES: nif-specific transcriptional activator NifA [Klebsiella]|uniref:nif-specific transcriptional activator NifA n=1 Tax=Klebsiella TaxID=570 RepID=UPI000C7AB081|nr:MULTISPECIES: nif-specific transcriptional activator NifA [Klebsiella]HBZ7746050.1 nif-specific transcriptional activator NifA [Klebsiella variicola subsp. variicola]AVJ59212.1 nif-specific transcriptional activator NifA [Klebsiella variicola]MBC4918263.1 nif-specific transcriptional activator NifA [Klebsiella variicola]MBZ6719591.1 nif-specific transcriptional activator NifA [Klebsiella variicola]MCP9030075.1 nif-specific transcriptional activator NifA [Klebsiella sp. SWET4]
MIPESDPDTSVRRFDLSQQFTAMQRISVVLSRATEASKTLQEVLSVLHNDAFMQHGMICLYDSEQEILSIEALQQTGQQPLPGSTQIRYRPGEGLVGTVLAQGQSLVLPRVADDQRFLDRLSLYDYDLPFIAVPLMGPNARPIGVLAAQPMARQEERLPACTRFLETVANLVAQTIRLMILPASPALSSRQPPKVERPPACSSSRGVGLDNMVGKSPAMRQIVEVIRQVSRWDTTVLVRGESGTGKELIANAIHHHSPRAGAAFVKFNCAALPDTLLESELFGHEKGAFTGAVRQRKGRFELADGGTLFLDEIGESSASFQAKLLRILQEGEMERVGGDETLRVNVRIIAATNRHLEEEVRLGHFREDLYYRLNVMPIALPPLRERQEDIAELAHFLVRKIGQHQGRTLRISEGAIRLLMEYSWPGNVRELENCLERSAVMSESGLIDRDVILFTHQDRPAKALPASGSAEDSWLDNSLDERQRLIAALEKAGWVQAKAARLLGMTPRQVAYRIQIMDITLPRL